MKKVLGMGNALVDVLVSISDDRLLEKFELPKGSMQLVDRERSQSIINALGHLDYEIASGGSAANTINGLANLGISCGYIGKIRDDKFGKIFSDDMTGNGIEADLMYGKQDTGIATTLISEDSQRTFATYLGAAVELSPEDLKEGFFKGYDYFHIEGYLVQNHELILSAVKLAKKNGLKISIDMASYNVVEAHLDFLKTLVEDYVDIVFANEEESKSFAGKDPEEALIEISKMCEIAVVKVGAKGSLVKTPGEQVFVDAIEARLVDTTGAGDLYASGFLFGLSCGQSLEKCAQLGSLLGGHVIEVIGPKMNDDRWAKIKTGVREILS
ncbi:MAG: adenosine kinase [Cytophagales bacterium]|nr:adenosine kinase [Cytophagales bacterium]